MEVSNGGIYASQDSLRALVKTRLPVKVSLQVVKLAKELSEQFAIIAEVKNGLIKTHGETNKQGLPEVIFPQDPTGRPPSPNWGKFVVENNELMAQTVELKIEKIKLPSEVDGKPLNIEPSILIDLEKFVEVV